MVLTLLLSYMDWTTVGMSTVVSIVSWLIYRVTIYPQLSPLSKMPSPPVGNYLTGNLMDDTSFTTWSRNLQSGVYSIRLFLGKQGVVVCDKESLKHVLVTNCNNYKRPQEFFLHTKSSVTVVWVNHNINVFNRDGERNEIYTHEAPTTFEVLEIYVKERRRIDFHREVLGFLGENVFTTSGEEHARNRHIFQAAFKPIFKTYQPITQKVGEKLVSVWKEKLVKSGDLVEVEIDILKAMIDITFEMAMGIKIDTLSNPTGDKATIVESFTTRMGFSYFFTFFPFLKLFFVSSEQRKKDNINEQIMSFTRDTIAMKKTETRQDDIQAGDFLSHLMTVTDPATGEKLTEKQLFDNTRTLIVAAHETTATTLVWCMHMLSRHHAVQDRVQEEVTSLLPPPGEPITQEHLDQLTYLGCVIKETLRLCTTLPVTLRETIEEDVISGYTVPSGTMVLCSFAALHRNLSYWEHADDFRPERFLDGRTDAYMPFGSGAFMCVGNRMALNEIKMLLALILRHFRIRPLEGQVYQMSFQTVVKLEPPLKCRLNTVIDSLI